MELFPGAICNLGAGVSTGLVDDRRRGRRARRRDPHQRAGDHRRRADHRPRFGRRAELRRDDRAAGAVRLLRRRRTRSRVPVVRRGRCARATSTSAASATGSSASAASSTSARTRGASIFSGTLTAGDLDIGWEDGRTVIRKEGRHRKFVPKLEQVCYSASMGARARTGRAVRHRARGVPRRPERPRADRDRAGPRRRARRDRADGIPARGVARSRSRWTRAFSSPALMGLAARHPREAARLSLASASRDGTKRAGRRRNDRRASPARRGSTRSSAIRSRRCGSPKAFTERFAAAGKDAVLVPVHVPAERFDTIVPGIDGHRKSRRAARHRSVQAADAALRKPAWTCREVHQRGERAAARGRRVVDGRHVRRRRIRARDGAQGRSARAGGALLLFGAGGAGSAIAYELAKAGVAAIAIADPQAERAAALAKTLRVAVPGVRGHGRTIGALRRRHGRQRVAGRDACRRRAAGRHRHACARDMLVGDVVVSDSPTPLIRQALRHGCAHVTGRDMLSGQVDAILDFFGSASGPTTSPQRTS